jgi:uncharacterized membrane protein YdbT with pleckstrin-like domain
LGQTSASKSSETIVVRPSTRLVKPFYTTAIVLFAVVFGLRNNDGPEWLQWLLAVPAACLFIWTVMRHIRLRFTTLTVSGGKMRYQTGMLSKSTRTLELSKVQDVRVDQTLTQRLLKLGSIRVETAGDSEPLSMKNIDEPQAVADFILEAPRK